MECRITVMSAFVLDLILNGGLIDFNLWLEEKGVDPFKRPLEYKINLKTQLLEVWQ